MSTDEVRRLLTALRDDPAALAEVREAVLTQDLLAQPLQLQELLGVVSRLAEAQERTEVRLAALAERVDRLAEAQERTEARLAALVEAQESTEARLTVLAERVDRLAEAQERTEVRMTALLDAVAKIDRRTGHLERMAGAAFERDLEGRIAGLLARAGLEVAALSRVALTRHLQRQGAEGRDLSRINGQPDWHGIARGPGGSALVLAEASITADDHDVRRLVEWRQIATRYGAPTIAVLLARFAGADFPDEELLRRLGITWDVAETGANGIPQPELAPLDL